MKASTVKTEIECDNKILICYPVSLFSICDNLINSSLQHIIISSSLVVISVSLTSKFFYLVSHLMRLHTITVTSFQLTSPHFKLTLFIKFYITVTHHKYEQQYVN